MTARYGQIAYRPLRAPREDRTALIDPPFDAVGELVRENVQLRGKHSYDFHGRSLADLRALARAELLRNARRWTAAYRDVPPPATGQPDLIFLAGHQPQIFHPGVWLKNFALGALARRHAAQAVNLVIDSDAAQSTALRVPGGTPAQPRADLIPFDRATPAIPFEERSILDRELFASFGSRVAAVIGALVPDPLIDAYWPLVLRRMAVTDNLGACLAQARHQLEGRWGLETWEIPQSWVCAAESFCWFAAHLLAELPRFRDVYNEAVGEYRRVYRVRSTAHPVPDLAAEGPWLEAPLWVWTGENPRRRRLFACRRNNEIALSDRNIWEIALPLPADGDASAAVDRLLQLRQQGVKIRSRALITTLWARLVLGDLFVHGIGGAKYDQVTDLLMERFFGLRPPGVMVLSATLHLPVAHAHATPADARAIGQRLRELTYHPERYYDGSGSGPAGAADDPAELIAAKAQWIGMPQTPQNARTCCRAIREINQRLQPFLAAQRAELIRRQAQIADALQAEAILAWREYGFCLYPEKILREFFAGLLPKSA